MPASPPSSRLNSLLRPILNVFSPQSTSESQQPSESANTDMSFLPCSFDDLKKRDGAPLQAWGLYGDNDLGRLNLITPESVKRGRDAVQYGISINLNLPLTNFPTINPGRGGVEHKIIDNGNHCDCTVHFNTQCSTQWDGFRHVPYQKRNGSDHYIYYGGLTHDEAKDEKNTRYGTGNFAKHPITTRAHLLDIVEWLKKTGKPPLKPLTTETPITLEMLQQCAADYGIKFAPGDVIIVRSGFTEAVLAMSDEERAKYDPMEGATGVDATEELMRWVWDQGFPAVAGDTFAWEFWPPRWDRLSVHEVFLSGWGLPLGELFDLRELSAKCKELNKYTFFLTTMALNIDAGVGTPVNGQAIL